MKPSRLKQLKDHIDYCKTKMQLSDGDDKIPWARVGLHFTNLYLGLSDTLLIDPPVLKKQYKTYKKKGSQRGKNIPKEKISDRVCRFHGTNLRIYIQRNSHHASKNGVTYTYPVYICRECFNENQRIYYKMKKEKEARKKKNKVILNAM